MNKPIEQKPQTKPDSLAAFEQQAIALYTAGARDRMSGQQRGGIIERCFARIDAFAAEFPEAGPEELWAEVKRRYPKLVWDCVDLVRRSDSGRR